MKEKLQGLIVDLLEKPSMIPRHEFAYIKDQHIIDKRCNIKEDTRVASRNFPLPFLSVSGDVGQLPTIGAKKHNKKSKLSLDGKHLADKRMRQVIGAPLSGPNNKDKRQ